MLAAPGTSVSAFLTGSFAKYPAPKAMHWTRYQSCSALVICARPASESAFLAGTLAKYMAPKPMQPIKYHNDSAALSRAVRAIELIYVPLLLPVQPGVGDRTL